MYISILQVFLLIQAAIKDLSDVYSQVQNSLDFAELTKKLQQERVSVALNFLIKERESKYYILISPSPDFRSTKTSFDSYNCNYE